MHFLETGEGLGRQRFADAGQHRLEQARKGYLAAQEPPEQAVSEAEPILPASGITMFPPVVIKPPPV